MGRYDMENEVILKEYVQPYLKATGQYGCIENKTELEQLILLDTAQYVLDTLPYKGTRIHDSQVHAFPRLINGEEVFPTCIFYAIGEQLVTLCDQDYTSGLKNVSVGEIRETYVENAHVYQYVTSRKAQMFVQAYLLGGVSIV